MVLLEHTQVPFVLTFAEPLLRSALEESGADVNHVIESMLSGASKCWIIGDINGLKGVVVGLIHVDGISGLKDFMIYALALVGQTTILDWNTGFEILSRYAKSQGCDRLTFFTGEETIAKLAEQYGAKMLAFCYLELA